MSKTDGQLTLAQTVDLTSLLTEFDDVFSDVPGRTTLGEHRTELVPGTKPIRCTPYRLSPEKAKVLKDELGNLLRQGIIEEALALGLHLLSWSPKLTVPYDFALTFVKSTAVRFQILFR